MGMEATGPPSARDRWRRRFQAGNGEYRAGSRDEASEGRRAAREHARAIGEAAPELAITLTMLAAVESARGALDEAERRHLEALDLWRRLVGAEHANVSGAHTSLALLYRQQQRWEDAEKHIGHALDIDRRTLGA